MTGRNFFEMLGLEFDPPENPKKIRAVFDEWKKKLTAEQNTTVDATRLSEIKEELAMSGSIETVIENPNLRQIEAKKLKEQRVEQLRLYIDLLLGDSGGTLQVTQTQMKKVKEKLKLSLATIESTYKQKGFEIKKARTKNTIMAVLNDFFMSDSVMNELRKNFADFQTVPDRRNYPWSAEVNDLYELAFNIEHRTEPNVDSYRCLSTDKLSQIFQNEAKKVAEPIPAWYSIKAILHIAQMQIFNSNENRYKYDHSLKLETLNKFFLDLKAAPEIFKRDSYFADNCIERIRKYLPSVPNQYELAAALYNKAAGLLNEPYESTGNANETAFIAECGNCHTYLQFRTKEAVLQTKCPMCGESFYMDCPKCHKKIPTNSERCPHCEFPILEMRNFPNLIDKANELLSVVEKAQQVDVNVEVLMNHIIEIATEAKMIKPDDLKLKALENRIDKAIISQKKLKLKNWAESKMPSLSAAPDKALSDCLEILKKIKNYRPALERLRLIKPKTPVSISAVVKEIPSVKSAASIMDKINVTGKSTNEAALKKTSRKISVAGNEDDLKLTCTVTWQPANDLEIKYQLVRKVNGIPQNNKDGDILIDKTDKLEYQDTAINAGVMYGYAVFATRAGVVSEPATCEVVHYSDLDENKFIARTEDGFCHFSWTLPSKNCLGVRILRSDNEGNSVVIADNVQSPFVDRAVKSRKQYQYRVQCVYYSASKESITERDFNRDRFFNSNGRDYNRGYNEVWKINRKYEYSYGLTVTLLPEAPPEPLQNIKYRVKNSRVNFTWKSTGDFPVLFREVKNPSLNVDDIIGRQISINSLDTIFGSKKILARSESRLENCEFSLTENFNRIAIVTVSKTTGVISMVVSAANVTPCTIDKDKTAVVDGKLKIILNPLAANLVKIHYAVNTRNSKVLFETVAEAKANRMRFVTAKKYEQDKAIIVYSQPQAEIYITVIGEYKMSDGSAVYSEPSEFVLNNRPKAEVAYWLEWGSSGFLTKTPRAKNCKLVLSSDADYIPKLYLAYNRNGGLNIEPGEASTNIIHTIGEFEDGLLNGKTEIFLPDSTWENITPGTVVKLLPSKRDAKYFEVRPSKPDSLKIPPK